MVSSPKNHVPDGKFNHILQIEKRLEFIDFVLNCGSFLLEEREATRIWNCLIENPAFGKVDIDLCFEWFYDKRLPALHEKQFFLKTVLKINPDLISELGFGCFEKFVKSCNQSENAIGGAFLGLDHLWTLVLSSKKVTFMRNRKTAKRVSEYAMELIEDISFEKGQILLPPVSMCEKLKKFNEFETINDLDRDDECESDSDNNAHDDSDDDEEEVNNLDCSPEKFKTNEVKSKPRIPIENFDFDSDSDDYDDDHDDDEESESSCDENEEDEGCEKEPEENVLDDDEGYDKEFEEIMKILAAKK